VVGASLLLNPKPTETGDVPGFRATPPEAARASSAPTGNPILAWHFHAVGTVLEVSVVGDRVYFRKCRRWSPRSLA